MSLGLYLPTDILANFQPTYNGNTLSASQYSAFPDNLYILTIACISSGAAGLLCRIVACYYTGKIYGLCRSSLQSLFTSLIRTGSTSSELSKGDESETLLLRQYV